MARCFVKIYNNLASRNMKWFMEFWEHLYKCVEENRAGPWEVGYPYVYLTSVGGVENVAYIDCHNDKETCIEFARKIKECLIRRYGYEPDDDFEIYVDCI